MTLSSGRLLPADRKNDDCVIKLLLTTIISCVKKLARPLFWVTRIKEKKKKRKKKKKTKEKIGNAIK